MDIDPRVLPDSQNEEELQEPQKTPEGAAEPKSEEENLNVDDLKRKAEVSSQNYERAKKAELRVKELEKLIESKSSEEPEYLTDDEVTRKDVSEIKKELASFKENQTLERLGNLYPAIKEKSDEFEEFKMEYPGIALDKVAKIFVAEKGYVEQLKPRLGLEKPTGGFKSQIKSGFSHDEIKRLRETQPRRYEQMLRSGKINPDDIS